MKALEKKGIYDPFNHMNDGLNEEATRMWQTCWKLHYWRNDTGWAYRRKGVSPNTWYMLAGALLALGIIFLCIFPKIVMLSTFSKIVMLVPVLLTVPLCIFGARRSERTARKRLDADSLWQRSEHIYNALSAYGSLVDYYNAYFDMFPDDTDRLNRVSAFLSRVQDIVIRKATEFNAAIAMMKSERELESHTGNRVALAELTAEPDQTAALASVCGLADPDAVLLTDQELLEVEQELQEALHGNLPPQALTGTRT